MAADCPIFIIFKHSHLCIFHHCAVVYKALRGFQQFKELSYTVTSIRGYILNPIGNVAP
nr:MAG TPA: hypothetical protein [Caudoviricetes sp.]DAN05222.1 MAG TPA: hypothetical protein [Caudoviricetes sp.]